MKRELGGGSKAESLQGAVPQLGAVLSVPCLPHVHVRHTKAVLLGQGFPLASERKQGWNHWKNYDQASRQISYKKVRLKYSSFFTRHNGCAVT
jgi:hypothetical protein